MIESQTIQTDIQQILELMREKLGIRGTSLTQVLTPARRVLPAKVFAPVKSLAKAEVFLDHPKLRLTLDTETLARASQDIRAHLDAVDASDRRKGWWLGMLGGLSFNLIIFVVLLIAFLFWRGIL